MINKITIIGNSVALRIRPVEDIISQRGKVYGILLEEKLNKSKYYINKWEINNLSMSRLIIKEIYDKSDVYLRTFPKVFIINIGCVDAPNREVPLWFSDIIFKRKFIAFHKLFNCFYKLIKKNYMRKMLVHLRGKKSWVSHPKFKFYFEEIIKILYKDSNALIIVLGINSGSSEIEKLLPDTNKKFKEYSRTLEDICQKFNIEYIDVGDLKSESYFPDGVHYNYNGHVEIANRLYDVIIKNIKTK